MFKEGQRVTWSEASGLPVGVGRIRGLATVRRIAIESQATIGRGYIVKPDVSLKNWQYSHIVIFECHLRAAEEQDEQHAWMESVNRDRELDMDLTEADVARMCF